MGIGSFVRGRVALLGVALQVACAHAPAASREVPAALVRGDPRFFRWPVRQLRYFVPEPGCGQGPYQIRVAAAEARWGQQLELWAYGPRILKGNVEVTFHPGEASRQSFGGGAALDNAGCVLRDDELVTGPGGGQASAGSGSAVPGISGAAARTPARPVVLREIPRPAVPPAGGRLDVRTIDLSTDDHKPYPRTFVTYRIWFDEPVDLTGVVFVTGLYVGELVVPEAQFLAHERAEEARARAEQLRYQAEQTRRNEEAWRKEAERTRFCNDHPRDTGCWGPGGLAGHLARQENERRETLARLERERQAEAARLERERRSPPPPPSAPPPERTAPPAARAESQPPKPSAHATWFAGYWRWNDDQGWLWLGGRWRVPPEDVQHDLTVHAPAPPPPPKPEAPPPPPPPPVVAAAAQPKPMPAAVAWTPGFWQWDGRAFVWVIGSWQLLPQPGAIWSPDRWEARGRVSVYVPGGWRLGR